MVWLMSGPSPQAHHYSRSYDFWAPNELISHKLGSNYVVVAVGHWTFCKEEEKSRWWWSMANKAAASQSYLIINFNSSLLFRFRIYHSYGSVLACECLNARPVFGQLAIPWKDIEKSLADSCCKLYKQLATVTTKSTGNICLSWRAIVCMCVAAWSAERFDTRTE